MKKNLAVLFGGRCVEHEISIISGIQLIESVDQNRYNVIPVYIAQNGRWYSDNKLLDKIFYKGLPDNLYTINEVTLFPYPGQTGLTILSKKSGLSKLFGSSDEILPVDVFLPVFHGDFGEDGCIQGLFELADMPYASSNVMASAVAMNKQICKLALSAAGIPVLPSVVVEKHAALKNLAATRDRIISNPALSKFPLFVKPVHLGSSIGINKAKDEKSLDTALIEAFKYDSHVIVEPCVSEIMEINVSVKDGDPPVASVTEIPVASAEFLSYEDKYMRGGGKKTGESSGSQGMAGLTRIIDPQDLDPNLKKLVIDYALKAFAILECSGVGRFDFIFDISKNELYFNELNPIPGSMAFYLWAKNKPPVLYTQLINDIVERAFEVKGRKTALIRDAGFKAMK